MKYISLLFFCISCFFSHGQIKYIGQSHFELTEVNWNNYYYPKLYIEDDTIYVSTNSGIFKKTLTQNDDWESYAFKGIPIIEFVKNEDYLLAISTGINNKTDSLLLLSKDKGRTIENLRPIGLIKSGINTMCRIAQNPENKNSILVLNLNSGLFHSPDFGDNWNSLSTNSLQWYAGFHPLDTSTLFYSGETASLTGMIRSSYNSGKDWFTYLHQGEDNGVHHIAYHPTNPNILFYSGEGTIGKSIDKGATWNIVDLYNTGMYFYKIIFDINNPDILYATGSNGNSLNKDTVFIYRSIDGGNTWNLAYKEYGGLDYGRIIDIVLYKNKLIFLTKLLKVFELDLGNIQTNTEKISLIQDVEIFQNSISGAIQFRSKIKIKCIDFIDLSGKILKRINVSEDDNTISTSHLQKGIYYLSFYTDKGSITKKILVAN